MSSFEAQLDEAARKNETTGLDIILREYHQAFPDTNPPLAFLSRLLCQSIKLGSLNFAEELIQLWPAVAWPTHRGEREGSVMHICCEHGHVAILILLIRLHPGLCLWKDEGGRIPLHVAATKDNVEVLNMLVYANRDSIMEVTQHQETVMHLAAKNGHAECFRFLMNQCFENKPWLLDWKDGEGRTVLHIATTTKNTQVLHMLLYDNPTKGPVVNVNGKDKMGFTALECHCHSSSVTVDDERITELLLKFGAKEEHTSITIWDQRELVKRKLYHETAITASVTVFVLFAGGSFAGLANYDNLYSRKYASKNLMIGINSVIMNPSLLPDGFYFVLMTTVTFMLSMLMIAVVIWPLKNIFCPFSFRAAMLSLIGVSFVTFALMVNLFVPRFYVRTIGTSISSVWLIWLYGLTISISLPTLGLLARYIYLCSKQKFRANYNQ